MAERKKPLNQLFAPENRHDSFGPVLVEVTLKGFRGIPQLNLRFDSPITAFSGVNGSGKSTLIQLLACAYRQPKGETKRYYIRDFFPRGQLDPAPFGQEAVVEYQYASPQGDTKRVTVKRTKSAWSGYERQSERLTTYVGVTFYTPKVERKPFTVVNSQQVSIHGSRRPTQEAVKWTQSILGNTYDDVDFAHVRLYEAKEADVGRLSRDGTRYSENNMGCGEGRVLNLVDLFETSPEQSLFVLEEPETSLHPHAQHRLAEYLVDVVRRKRHQVFLSTHAKDLLSGLPSESRKLLVRKGSMVIVVDGASINEADCFLSGYERPALVAFVEDDVSKAVLVEIVRCVEPDLLWEVKVEVGGGRRAVLNQVRTLREYYKDRPAIPFLDGDCRESCSRDGVHYLPGSRAPEFEILSAPGVHQYLKTEYGFDVKGFLEAESDRNHHAFFGMIAQRLCVSEEHLLGECAREYARGLTEDEKTRVIRELKAALGRKSRSAPGPGV